MTPDSDDEVESPESGPTDEDRTRAAEQAADLVAATLQSNRN